MRKYLREEVTDPSETVVCAFGRLNPMTIGHEKLINTLERLATQRSSVPAKLYLSHSCDPKKNPLTYESKVKWARRAFGDKVEVVESNAINMFFMMHELYEQGFKHVIYVCGEDRFEDTSRWLTQANGQEFDKKGKSLLDTTYYKFDTLTFEDAGHRDENSADLVEKASASLAREYALEGKLEEFKEIVPFNEDDATLLFDELQTGLGL